MDAFAGAFVFFAALFLTGVAGGVFVLYWFAVRARKAARLEMKRHVQRI